MKKYSYGKLINMSWSWTVQILFRPFSLKKWIMLSIIIILSGQISGNINISGKNADFGKIKDLLRGKIPVTSKVEAPFEIARLAEENPETQDISFQRGAASRLRGFAPETRAQTIVILIVAIIALLVVAFILLWMWINANFSFVFVDSVVRNDASLRVPFHRNKVLGNSYFGWNIVFSLITFSTFGIILFYPIRQLIKAKVFTPPPPLDVSQILSILLQYVPVILIAGITFLLIGLFVRDFVLPIMYKKKIGISKAWGIFLGLLRRNMGEMLLYLLVKIGLFILALIAAAIIAIVGLIVLLVLISLVALLGWLIYAITPAAVKTTTLTILILIGIPVFIFLGFLFNLIFIPIPIFFRVFSIFVLGSIDESLDLFAPKTTEEIAAEEDIDKYKKSMALVWFAVLLPFILILFIIFAIAIPGFQKGRERVLQRRQPEAGGEVFQKMPILQDLPIEKLAPAKKLATIYLKNGNTFEAEIESESENDVTLRIEGGTYTLPRSDILRIEK